MSITQTGAENVCFDLDFLYKGIDDPQIDADVAMWVQKTEAFHAAHKGNLHQTLGQALRDYEELDMLRNKTGYFLFLKKTQNTTDEVVKSKTAEIERLTETSAANFLSFFTIEIASIPEERLEELYAADPFVKRYRPWITQVRVFKEHQLEEGVESALAKRARFGAGAWSGFFNEVEADLRFTYSEQEKTLEEMLHVLSESTDPKERADVLKIINDGLGGRFAKFSAQTLNMAAGAKEVEDTERKYRHPMEGRNKGGQIPDAVVEALHDAVMQHAAPLAQKFYRLKAAHLGLKKLAWSDRNAPMPFASTTITPWGDAVQMVLEAYGSFSPTLASIVQDTFDAKLVDAPAVPGKRGGAFNASCCLPGGKAISFTFLNYQGGSRDVMTLAHELGHGVHGILSGNTQGPIMMRYPMAYAETASVFGEMVTFESLKKKALASGNTTEALALLMKKIDDTINTVVRQIGFSNFERVVHLHDGKSLTRKKNEKLRRSPEEFGKIWEETRNELYGVPGDVFTYENTNNLWSYVSHFHRPFYVYAYAFGDLLTHSLYAKRAEFGDRFEPLYLELLSSGGTKNVVELLDPFGLDPTSPTFWKDGIDAGLGTLLREAEELSRDMGVEI